jgi:hypothetical protein
LDWQSDWVYKAYDLNIIQGFNIAEFKPNQPITRAEALKVIIETFDPSHPDISEIEKNDVFTDIKDHWAKSYILIGVALNLIEGYKDDMTFRPNNAITRAEAVKIISLMIG